MKGCENPYCRATDECIFAPFIDNPVNLANLEAAEKMYLEGCADRVNQEPRSLSKVQELKAEGNTE